MFVSQSAHVRGATAVVGVDHWVRAVLEEVPSAAPTVAPITAVPTTPSNNGNGDNLFDAFLGAVAFLVGGFLVICMLVCIVQLCLKVFPHNEAPPAALDTSIHGEETEVRSRLPRDRSALAHAAGLTPGLLLPEREQILKALFAAKCFSWETLLLQKKKSQAPQNPDPSLESAAAKNNHPRQLDHDSIAATARGLSIGESGTSKTQQSPQPQEQQHCDNNTLCSICLMEYTLADKELVQGVQCPHVFHLQCCLKWLQKHDHCPFCRAEMMTVDEFGKAAVETLGDERVQQLQTPPTEEENNNP